MTTSLLEARNHVLCRTSLLSAESEGFEPSMDGTAHTGFRGRRILELCVIRDAATIGYGFSTTPSCF